MYRDFGTEAQNPKIGILSAACKRRSLRGACKRPLIGQDHLNETQWHSSKSKRSRAKQRFAWHESAAQLWLVGASGLVAVHRPTVDFVFDMSCPHVPLPINVLRNNLSMAQRSVGPVARPTHPARSRAPCCPGSLHQDGNGRGLPRRRGGTLCAPPARNGRGPPSTLRGHHLLRQAWRRTKEAEAVARARAKVVAVARTRAKEAEAVARARAKKVVAEAVARARAKKVVAEAVARARGGRRSIPLSLRPPLGLNSLGLGWSTSPTATTWSARGR